MVDLHLSQRKIRLCGQYGNDGLKSMQSWQICKRHDIGLSVKVHIFCSLIQFIALHGCKSWTLTSVTKKYLQMSDTKSFQKILNIKCTDHRTNVYMKGKNRQQRD